MSDHRHNVERRVEAAASATTEDQEFKVGYSRPPRQHQFKKGKSGNPKGRPRAKKSFLALVVEAMEERVAVQEAGERKTIKKLHAAAKQVANKAASGDYRTLKLLLELMSTPDWKAADADPVCTTDPADRLMKRMLEIRARRLAEQSAALGHIDPEPKGGA